jgi:hypothetical protein
MQEFKIGMSKEGLIFVMDQPSQTYYREEQIYYFAPV